MAIYRIVSTAELAEFLMNLPVDSEVSFASDWDVNDVRPDNTIAAFDDCQGFYGIRKIEGFDSDTCLLVIDYYGGGNAQVYEADQEYLVDDLASYLRHRCAGTTIPGHVCLEIEEAAT